MTGVMDVAAESWRGFVKMRLIFGGLFLCLCLAVNASAQSTNWSLVWNDEFDGTALNTSKWIAVTNCGDQHNNEQQCYMADDVSLANGILTIKPERRSMGGFAYTSGAVKTGTKYTVGPESRVEFRAQLPAGGQGLWPALWMYPPNQWPPEIDLVEAVNDMSEVFMTYHWGSNSDPQQDYSSVRVSNPSAWHVYAMEWQSGVVRWYIDNVLVKTYSGPTVSTIPMQLYMNVALGGDWPGGVAASTVLPQTMNVDYVRVYSANGTAPPSDTTAPSVSMSTPTGGSTVSGTTTLTATASDGVGVTGVWFAVDGQTVGSEDASAPYQATWDTTTVANGSHTLQAMARDAAGNTGTSSSVTITVNNTSADKTAPTVSVTSPANGSSVNGAVTVTATATDNVGVTSVQFLLDGANLGSQDTAAPYPSPGPRPAPATGHTRCEPSPETRPATRRPRTP